jgi:ABC-type multidrug transport system permease subunit
VTAIGRSSLASVALGLGNRQVTILAKNPTLFLPPMLFPLMSLLAFSGGLSQIRSLPGFDYEPGYAGFQFVFVLCQASAFGGVFAGFGIARDFENGFARRLLLAAPHRSGLIAGYALGALTRWVAVAVMLTIVALILGMKVGGNGIDLFGLYALALVVNVCGLLWAAGVAMRLRTIQAGPLMQTPVFMLLFLTPVYVPLDLLRGWIHAVASVNPVTVVLTAGRSLLAGQPEDVGLAAVVIAAVALALAAWALRSLRSAEAAG